MEKKKYEKATVEFTLLESDDVITVSDGKDIEMEPIEDWILN